MEQHLRFGSDLMNPNFAISVLTVKGQFVIGNSRGENADSTSQISSSCWNRRR